MIMVMSEINKVKAVLIAIFIKLELIWMIFYDKIVKQMIC